jgi:hypothetical protein
MLRAFFASFAFIAACTSHSDPPPPACVGGLSLDCKPLYDPTFQNLFDKTFHPTCAAGRGTCHTADAAKAGLVFENADDAYGLLLGTKDGRKRVVPGDPSCSLLIERLASADPSFHMPPGASILPAEECAIVQWIQSGAKR